jgi:hypothetical protein
MWDSNGPINEENIQWIDSAPGDMHVSGDIDGNSFVYLVSTQGSIYVDGAITGGSMVILISLTGAIAIRNWIDGNSNVSLKAASDVTIGTQGDNTENRIDASSQVNVEAGGNILLHGLINNATADFKAHGGITVVAIDNGATVRQVADGDVIVAVNIDTQSRVDLVSNQNSVRIHGRIAGNSRVSLTAKQDAAVGLDAILGDIDRTISGDSLLTAIAGRFISVGNGISGGHTNVDFAAENDINIGGSISGGSFVRALSDVGQINVGTDISDDNTQVRYFPNLNAPNINGSPTLLQDKWVEPATLSVAEFRKGFWWENWAQSFGYVAPFRAVPRSVDDIAAAILAFGHGPIKALGGGFSFSDLTLPFLKQEEVNNASILLRGSWQRQNMEHVLEGVDPNETEPMDLVPEAVGRNLAFSTLYDQKQLLQVTSSGAQLPPTRKNVVVGLIDTRSLASSLQCEFRDIQVPSGAVPATLFHVEAGITMADLQQLLDHQYPRLAIRASTAGPSDATLAGLVSTATHGSEFRWSLPADAVQAIHLVGPGGEQWWIEGDVRVADQKKLVQRYPAIDQAHFIGKGWNGIPGLTSQDVLDAVTVSMGTMGVIYSVVLEVVQQFGLRQVVQPTTWPDLLARANVTTADLSAGNSVANQAVLNVLLDGSLNGTGIAYNAQKKDNVFANLRINPFNLDCWMINREVTPDLPGDANNPSPDFLTPTSRAIASHAMDDVQNSLVLGRIFNFLSYETGIVDYVNDANQAQRLLSFISGLGDPAGGTLGAASVQAAANFINAADHPDRGQQFLGDVVSGVLHGIHGTGPGQSSDRTDLSYKLGAVAWPGNGLPARAVEIALDPRNAFTFLQTVLFDDVLNKFMWNVSPPSQLFPLIGVITVRVCPTTKTLMGMQQYSPYTVMVEVFAYRSPESDYLMDMIQAKTLEFSTALPKPLLHWGLENAQLTAAYLTGTPLGQPYKANFTRLKAFTAIRNFLKKGHPAVFDNNFSSRLGL